MQQARGLARFLNIPGGITLEDAERRAANGLDRIREHALADIRGSLHCFAAYLGLLKGTPPAAVRDELHRLAYCVVSLSGTFGREGLGKAAYAMCDLLDALQSHDAWDRGAIDVHYNAMRLLIDVQSKEEEEALLSGLRKVKHRLVGASQ